MGTLNSNYAPQWDVDKARGEEAERLYARLGDNILTGSAEVKRDDVARSTGNVYVEYECRRTDGWHLSGIAVTEADTWVYVLPNIIVAMPTTVLKILARRAWMAGNRRECVVGSHPTRGVTIPLKDLLLWAIAESTDKRD